MQKIKIPLLSWNQIKCQSMLFVFLGSKEIGSFVHEAHAWGDQKGSNSYSLNAFRIFLLIF